MKVTACLITWKRQYNLPQIIASLVACPSISEIIIRDNSKEENIINYGRYTSALKAENDIIFTQDDDCIVSNVEEIIKSFRKDPTRISYSGTKDYEDVIKSGDNNYGECQMAMAGWGSVFDRRWIPVLDEYTKKFGRDECFYRETDRIFSMLLKKHHNFIPGSISHLKGKDDEFALCNQLDHKDFKKLAINRCIELCQK